MSTITTTSRPLRRRATRLVAAGATVVALVAALSSGAVAGSTAKISPTLAVSNAQKFIAPYTTAPVTWQGPTTSPALVKGKTIVFLDIAPTIPTLQVISATATALAKKFDWKLKVIDVVNQAFSPAVAEAIDLHPSGILFNFEDVSNDPAAFAALAKSKIPVVTFGLSTDAANSTNPGITHIVNVQYGLQGQLLAAGAALLSNGDSKFGVLSTPDSSETSDTVNGIASYFKEHGGGSIVASDYVDPTELFNATAIGQSAVAFIEAHPTITQLFVIFDGVAAEVIPALKQAGLSRVQVVSAQGDAYNVNLIRTGGEEKADAVWPYAWATYAAFDDFNRIFNHVALPANDGVPLTLIDKADVYSYAGYWTGNYNFEAKYDSLWKIS